MQDLHDLESIRPETLVTRLAKHPHKPASERCSMLSRTLQVMSPKRMRPQQRVVEELRQMGHEALQAWAERKQARVEAASDQRADLSRKEKKGSPGTPASARLQ